MQSFHKNAGIQRNFYNLAGAFCWHGSQIYATHALVDAFTRVDAELCQDASAGIGKMRM